MRHVWSLLAGLIVAPLAWLFLATGQHRSQATVADWYAARAFDTADLIGPAVFLGVAGILLGLLGTLRWSPLGPLAAGALFVAPTLLMFRHPFRALDVFSFGQTRRVLGQDFQLWLPVENGTLLVIGALLLMATFSGQRWRRWPAMSAVPAETAPPAGLPASLTAPLAPAVPASTRPTQPPRAERISFTDDDILAAAKALEQESEPAATNPPSPPGQRDPKNA